MTSGCFRTPAQCVVRHRIHALTSSCLCYRPLDFESSRQRSTSLLIPTTLMLVSASKHFPGSDIIASRLDVLCLAFHGDPQRVILTACPSSFDKRQHFTPDSRQDSSWDRISLLRHQDDLPLAIPHIHRHRCAAATCTWLCLAQDGNAETLKIQAAILMFVGETEISHLTVYTVQDRTASRLRDSTTCWYHAKHGI